MGLLLRRALLVACLSVGAAAQPAQPTESQRELVSRTAAVAVTSPSRQLLQSTQICGTIANFSGTQTVTGVYCERDSCGVRSPLEATRSLAAGLVTSRSPHATSAAAVQRERHL
jgi:hypothetical protein